METVFNLPLSNYLIAQVDDHLTLIKVQKDSLYGYFDDNGKAVIPYKYKNTRQHQY